MNKKILVLLIVLLLLGGVWFMASEKAVAPVDNLGDQRVDMPNPEEQPNDIVESVVFSGKLEEVNTGCFADAECYVVVNGKHVTTTIGWSQEIVGSVLGVEGFGDLEAHIGEEMEVYAGQKSDGSYTLYGNKDYYIRLK